MTDLSDKRVIGKLVAGRPNDAQQLARELGLKSRYDQLVLAAQRAGKLREFNRSYEYVVKSAEADGLNVDREALMERLVPLAMADPKFAGQHAPGENVDGVVKQAKLESFETRQRDLDSLLESWRVSSNTSEMKAGKRRLRVDITREKADPLVTDEKGRFARVASYKRSVVAARANKFRRSLGANVTEQSTMTQGEAALRDLRDKYGVEIITPEIRKRMKLSRSHARSRPVRLAEAVPRGAFESFKWIGSQTLLARKRWKLKREVEAVRRFAKHDASVKADLIALEGKLAEVEGKLVTGGSASFGGALRHAWKVSTWFVRFRMIALLALLVGAFMFIGWTGSLALLLHALGVAVTSILNLFIGGLNGVLALFARVWYIGVSLVMSGINIVVTLAYDAVWSTFANKIPGVEYKVPQYAVNVSFIPQFSYVLSLFTTISIDDDGNKDIGLPVLQFVDADGRHVRSMFWSATGEYRFFEIESYSRVCTPDRSDCQNFWTVALSKPGGFVRDAYCWISNNDDRVC